MIKVITYGTFDLLHFGHIHLLRRAKSLGDYLIVGLSTDSFNVVKNKHSYHTYEEREEILSAIRYVDLIIPETGWEQKVEDIKKHKVDIFTIGNDWQGKFDYLSEFCKIHYLPRTEGISTTMIKNAYPTLNRNSTI